MGVKGSVLLYGIDVPGSSGTEMVAVADGMVIYKYNSNSSSGSGNCIGIQTNDKDPVTGKYLVVTYMHMQSASPLSVGDEVKNGSTVVGKRGNTGGSTGPHLHFQVTNYSNDTSTTAKAEESCKPPKSWDNYVNPIYFFSNKTLKYSYYFRN